MVRVLRVRDRAKSLILGIGQFILGASLIKLQKKNFSELFFKTNLVDQGVHGDVIHFETFHLIILRLIIFLILHLTNE